MSLTPERKAYIDSLSYSALLSHWRFAPVGDPWFQGETGAYWTTRMGEQRKAISDAEHIGASKALGWSRPPIYEADQRGEALPEGRP